MPPPPPPPSSTSDSAGASDDQSDPAFSRYVDIELLGTAWQKKDAQTLVDVAFQFAEGERVLRRSHKAIKASVVLDSALKMAIETSDKDSLSRLAKAFEQSGDKDRAAQVALALKSTGPARATDFGLYEGTTTEQLNAVMNMQERLEDVRLAGSAGDVTELEESLAKDAVLTAKQKEILKKMIGEARSEIPEKLDPSEAEGRAILAKLSKTSRVNLNPLSPEYNGTWRWSPTPNCMYRENFWFVQHEIWVAYWNGSRWVNMHLVPRDSAEWAKVMYGLTSGGWRTVTKGSDPKITTSVYVDPSNPSNIYLNNRWTTISSVLKAGLIGNDGASMVAAGGGNMVAAGGGNLIGKGGAGLIVVKGGANVTVDRGLFNNYSVVNSSRVTSVKK